MNSMYKKGKEAAEHEDTYYIYRKFKERDSIVVKWTMPAKTVIQLISKFAE